MLTMIPNKSTKKVSIKMDIAKALLWLSRDQFPPQKAFQFFFLLWNPGVKYRTSFSETFFHNVKIFELLLNLTGAQNSLS